MNYDSPDFSRLKTDYGIYSSKEDALQSVGCTSQDECTDETTCGFLFYHWCRGTDEVASYTAEDFFTSSTPKSEVKQYPHKSVIYARKKTSLVQSYCFIRKSKMLHFRSIHLMTGRVVFGCRIIQHVGIPIGIGLWKSMSAQLR